MSRYRLNGRKLMSALGQKQTYALHQPMSALPPIATLIAHFDLSALAISGHVRCTKNQSTAYEIDPVLDRHEVYDGPVPRCERLDVFSAVPVRFSERVFCALD